MRHEYVLRGRTIEIEELDDIVAAKTSPATNGERSVPRSLGTRADMPGDEATASDARAFANAGWVFVRPSATTRRAMETRAPVAGVETVTRVFRQPGGRLVLGTDRLSVKLRPGLDESAAEAALRARGLEAVNRLNFAPNLFEVAVSPGQDFLAVSRQLAADDDIVYAEPEFIEHVPGRFTPNDPDYGTQWHLRNTGQDGGTAGADVSAEEAWDTTRGAGLRVAVVDNGMDLGHPDLAAAVAATSGSFQDNGTGGANFVQGLLNFPDGNHGTFCSGMATARADNAEGVAGVANESDLLAVACLQDQVGTQATLARAIAYAADPSTEVPGANPDDGADVISCSLGPNGADWLMTSALQDAIDFAVANGRGGLGTPIFWAVSNGNFDLHFDEVCSYANTIHVGRSTRDDLEDNCAHGPELDFLATGVDVTSTESGGGYGASTGTSYAAPTAAGVAALVIATNPDLTWDDVRQVMRDTCDKVGGNVYDGAGHSGDYGFGRINAAEALCEAAWIVTLDTSSVMFNDVPEGETTVRAVVFSVLTCKAATFQVVSGPTVTSGPGSFGVLPSPTASLGAASSLAAREARLWLTFTGQNDGDITTGEVTVRLVETGEEWVVPISANTIARVSVAVDLVLDQSGSMLGSSGLSAFPTRADVLRFAAPVFVNLLQEGNGVGVVNFDEDAHNQLDPGVVGPPGPFDPPRAAALGVISGYAPQPAGLTSIADGVAEARARLNVVAGAFDRRAIVVFTDGFETAPGYLRDLPPGVIDERVFAIGLGTADQIQPTALSALTNNSGGYLLLTGALGPEDLFRLSKYYLQILAGVTNQDVVLDPEGAIKPGQVDRIPFQLNEADIGADAILLCETDLPVLHFELETPAGDVIDPSSGLVGVSFVRSGPTSFYRLSLPVPLGGGAGSGRWHARLSADPAYYKRYLSILGDKHDNHHYQQVAVHGVRYSLNVQSHSGLRLQASLTQNSFEPGATLSLRGVLSEYGLPVGPGRATVRAEYERPDGATGNVVLTEEAPGTGSYLATIPAPQAGVYPVRLLADGKTLRGRPFTREHLLSGAVWHGGDDHRPPSSSDEKPSTILNCLLGDTVLQPKLRKRLQTLGINLHALQRCTGTAALPMDGRPVRPTAR